MDTVALLICSHFFTRNGDKVGIISFFRTRGLMDLRHLSVCVQTCTRIKGEEGGGVPSILEKKAIKVSVITK